MTKRLLTALMGSQNASKIDPQKKISEIDKRLERIAGQIRNLYEDRAGGILPDDVFKRLMGGIWERV